jgi:hypothetical protein
MILSRRGLFGLGAAFVASPAIVRVSSLMPIHVPPVNLTDGEELGMSLAKYMESYVRPRIIRLSAEMDLAFYEVIYGTK